MKAQWFLLVCTSAILSGCQSGKLTHYTSPEITGRVLAADTRQPLANATVQLGDANVFQPFGPPKGGQLLMQTGVVRTDAAGKFVLGSKSVFAVFRQPGWWSVPVTFSHSGYEMLQTNYTGTNVTSHSDTGAPVVNAGEVLLKPESK